MRIPEKSALQSPPARKGSVEDSPRGPTRPNTVEQATGDKDTVRSE